MHCVHWVCETWEYSWQVACSAFQTAGWYWSLLKKRTSPSIQYLKGWATLLTALSNVTEACWIVLVRKANCCVFLCVQEKSPITVTGRDVAGNSPVRMSSRGIIGSTRATGPFSAKNATGPSPGPTISRCTWNGIYRTGEWTSEPSVAFEQKSTKLELRDNLCCPQDQGWEGYFFIRLVLVFHLFLSLSSSNMLAILSISSHTGTLLERASTYRQNLDVPSAKHKYWKYIINIRDIYGNIISVYVLKMPLIDLHFNISQTLIRHMNLFFYWSLNWSHYFQVQSNLCVLHEYGAEYSQTYSVRYQR